MQKIKRCDGITMMEVLITLAILAILVAIAVPSFLHYVQSNRLRAASNAVQDQLSSLRAEAMKRQQNVTAVFQSGSSWCVGGTTASSCDCSTAGSCTLGQISGTEFPDTELSLSGIGSSLIFTANRGSVNATESITVTIDSRYITLQVSQLGSVSVCSNSLSEYPEC